MVKILWKVANFKGLFQQELSSKTIHMRRTFSPSQKVAVVLSALKGDKTIGEICSEFSIHESQVHEWRNKAKAGLASLFETGGKSVATEQEKIIERLYALLGQRGAELAWLKKKVGITETG